MVSSTRRRGGKEEGGFKDRNEFLYQHETSANLEFSCLSLLKGPGLELKGGVLVDSCKQSISIYCSLFG